ncbi:protein FAM83D-like [Emydura macquarii macquarii]|uniref:protein FAM83D-like n=1 Tax=Emydura macquarii macquarii TaxID=1129001 RepID=UPI00352AF309
MANQSQCLEEAPGRWPRGEPTSPDLYSEAQRLALEELVAGGRAAFQAFLRREKVPGFLSEPEIQAILQAAAPPAGAEDGASELSVNASLDCSSLTYFPEQSDVEPPVLELGWPGFSSGSYRGLTRVEALFQPSFGETIYSCKEAVRRQIRSAREVIALVMDSFTDTDIFSDLQEAYRKRKIPVYILLDQDFLPHFMEMCRNLGVCPEQEGLMRVRTITGNTYYTRSGAKIVGKVHEKFMLIDGIRVTTGSYSFTWTDGKLNSSNLLLLSGQVAEHFDLEFRILYAQSKPISPKLPSSCRSSGVFDQLVNGTKSSKDCTVGNLLRAELARLSSTPKKPLKETDVANDTQGSKPYNLGPSYIGKEEWFGSQEVIVEPKELNSMSTQTEPWEEKPPVTRSNAITQTSVVMVASGTQTSVAARMTGTQTVVSQKTAMTQTEKKENVEVPLLQRQQSKEGSPSSTSSSLQSLSSSSSSSQCSLASSTSSLSSLRSLEYSGNHRVEYFQKLHKERQFHYSVIRSKLNQMVAILSRRGRLPENYTSCHVVVNSSMKPRLEISTSLLNLKDVSLFK